LLCLGDKNQTVIASVIFVTEVPLLVIAGGHNGSSPKDPRVLAVGGFLSSRFRRPSFSPPRFRPEIWLALFSLPRSLADAELLWTEVQRQRLPVDE
jgi:tryptophan-rich sensory protein